MRLLVDDELLRLGRAVHAGLETFPDQYPGAVRGFAAAQPGHVAGALHDRYADFRARLLSVDLDHDQWPSLVQWGIVFGSFGWFDMLFMIFCKIFPSVSMYEVKEMVYHRRLQTKKLLATAEFAAAGKGAH